MSTFRWICSLATASNRGKLYYYKTCFSNTITRHWFWVCLRSSFELAYRPIAHMSCWQASVCTTSEICNSSEGRVSPRFCYQGSCAQMEHGTSQGLDQLSEANQWPTTMPALGQAHQHLFKSIPSGILSWGYLTLWRWRNMLYYAIECSSLDAVFGGYAWSMC